MTDQNPDAPIEEIRELRRQISGRVGNDPAQLVEYYRKLQEKYEDRLLGDATTERKDQSAA
jgi:hypothetical protein